MELKELSAALCALPVGGRITLPLAEYEILFPPGEPDQRARERTGVFARAHGCEINNSTAGGEVLEVTFIKHNTSAQACA
jgi:hypothetical protein